MFFFVFINHTMRDARNDSRRCVKEVKLEKKNTIAVIGLRSDKLEKFLRGLGGFHPDPGFVRNTGTNRNDKQCLSPSSWENT